MSPTKNKRRAAFRKRLTSDPPPPDEATKAKLEAAEAKPRKGALCNMADVLFPEPDPEPKEPKP